MTDTPISSSADVIEGMREALEKLRLLCDQTSPGLVEAAEWHRREAKRLLNACSNQSDPIKARDHEDKSAWHEEAARKIEALRTLSAKGGAG